MGAACVQGQRPVRVAGALPGCGDLKQEFLAALLEPRAAVPMLQAPLAEPADRERVNLMFQTLYARGEACFVLAVLNREPTLHDQRSGVESFGDEMHGCAVLSVARGEHAAVGMQAGIGGQQGRMDVQDASGETRDELGR